MAEGVSRHSTRSNRTNSTNRSNRRNLSSDLAPKEHCIAAGVFIVESEFSGFGLGVAIVFDRHSLDNEGGTFDERNTAHTDWYL